MKIFGKWKKSGDNEMPINYEEIKNNHIKTLKAAVQWDGITPLKEIVNLEKTEWASFRFPRKIPPSIWHKYPQVVYTRQDVLRVLEAFLSGKTDPWDLCHWSIILLESHSMTAEDSTAYTAIQSLTIFGEDTDQEIAQRIIHRLKTEPIKTVS